MFDKHIKNKKAFIFELDNVLFPEKDYLLQVYYLFAHFIEYTEQIEARQILEYAQKAYENSGSEQLFEKLAKQFNLPEKYWHNFELLHQTARLPLKLLLYKNMLGFMQEIVAERKQIFIVTQGDPEQQLNKIKQTEWNGLEKHLTVYFSDELNKNKSEVYNDIIISNKFNKNDILVVGSNNYDEKETLMLKLSYINVKDILTGIC